MRTLLEVNQFYQTPSTLAVAKALNLPPPISIIALIQKASLPLNPADLNSQVQQTHDQFGEKVDNKYNVTVGWWDRGAGTYRAADHFHVNVLIRNFDDFHYDNKNVPQSPVFLFGQEIPGAATMVSRAQAFNKYGPSGIAEYTVNYDVLGSDSGGGEACYDQDGNPIPCDDLGP